MKNTQMIHSPRTFKLSLGLIIVVGLLSMPVLTQADDTSPTVALESEKPTLTAPKKDTEPISNNQPAEVDTKKAAKKSTHGKGVEKRISKLEGEAKKIAAALTPAQRTKLLAMLNTAEAKELTRIKGIGDSRSTAIAKARPIGSIEGVREIRGVGIKTLSRIVDHGKILSGETKETAPKSAERGETTPKK